MSSIIVPGTFTDSTLPVDADLKAQLLATASLLQWYQADAASTTQVGGVVSVMQSLKGDGKTATKDFAGTSAVLSAKSAIGSYDALDFSGVAGACGYTLSTSPVVASPFSLVFLVGALGVNPTTSQNLLYIRGDAGVSNSFYVRQGTHASFVILQAFFGSTGGLNITLSADAITALPTALVIVSGSGSTLRGRVNSMAVRTVAYGSHVPALPCRLGSDHLGAEAMKTWMSDSMIFNADILAAGNEALLATVLSYFNGTYGLAVV